MHSFSNRKLSFTVPLWKSGTCWIVLFFLLRLIGITNPPLEKGHNWRQATGLMVARNFYENDNNIFYPRIDDNEGKTGIIGMEFPLLNYTHYLVSIPFGFNNWYGRLINLIISSFGLFFFYKCLLKFFNREHALFALICLLASGWFAYSRKTMPDTFCISLMFIGLFQAIVFLERGKIASLLLFILFSSLAILSKIPAGIYFILLIPLCFYFKNYKNAVVIFLATSIPLTLAYFWYFSWNVHLSSHYGIWYNSGVSLATGFAQISENIGETFSRFYFASFCSYIFFALFSVGLIGAVIKKQWTIVIPFLLMLFIFLIYMFKSGYFLYHHDYCIIPFVPVMAVVAGYAFSVIIPHKFILFLLCAGVVESIANQQHDFFIPNDEKYKLKLEKIATEICSNKDLIAINGNGNPQQIFLSHQKGWTITNEQLADDLYVDSLQRIGCKYVFINKHYFADEINGFKVYNDDDFAVYLLTK